MIHNFIHFLYFLLYNTNAVRIYVGFVVITYSLSVLSNCTLGTRDDKNLCYMTEILYPGVCVTLHLWLTEHSGMQCCRRCTTPKASLALAGTACTATWASLAL